MAGDEPSLACRRKLWLERAAYVARIGAARVEAAAGWRRQRIGHVTLEHDVPAGQAGGGVIRVSPGSQVLPPQSNHP